MRIDEPKKTNPPLEQDWPETYSTVDDYELDNDGLPVHVKVDRPRDPEPTFDSEYPLPAEQPVDDGARLRQRRRPVEPTPKLTRAQQRLDEILTNSEDELRHARDLIVSALEDFALVAQPQHPNLPTLVGQQIEQVIEHRTLRRR